MAVAGSVLLRRTRTSTATAACARGIGRPAASTCSASRTTPGELILFAGDGLGAPAIRSRSRRRERLGAQPAGDRGPIRRTRAVHRRSRSRRAASTCATSRATTRDERSRDRAVGPVPERLVGAVVAGGTGDIEVTNEVGDLRVTGIVLAKTGGPGHRGRGRRRQARGAGSRRRDRARHLGADRVGRRADLRRRRRARAQHGRGRGRRRRDPRLARHERHGGGPGRFTATVEGGLDVARFDGSIGANRALRSFALSSPDAAPSTLELGGARGENDRSRRATARTRADAADGLRSGYADRVRRGRESERHGARGRIHARRGRKRWRIPPEATIAKPNGNLTLASTGGPVIIGDGDKLSVAGSLAISGSTVRVTDLSALDISVTSPDAQVFARAPGPVATAERRDDHRRRHRPRREHRGVQQRARPSWAAVPRRASRRRRARRRTPGALAVGDVAGGGLGRRHRERVARVRPRDPRGRSGPRDPGDSDRAGRAPARAAAVAGPRGTGRARVARGGRRVPRVRAARRTRRTPAGCAPDRAARLRLGARHRARGRGRARLPRAARRLPATRRRAARRSRTPPPTRGPRSAARPARPGASISPRSLAFSGRSGCSGSARATPRCAPTCSRRSRPRSDRPSSTPRGSAPRSTRARWACRSRLGSRRAGETRHFGHRAATIAATADPPRKDRPISLLRSRLCLCGGCSRSPCCCSARRPRAR